MASKHLRRAYKDDAVYGHRRRTVFDIPSDYWLVKKNRFGWVRLGSVARSIAVLKGARNLFTASELPDSKKIFKFY